MQGIIKKTNELDYNALGTNTSLELLFDHEDVEIMLQMIKSGDVVWLEASKARNTMEFCYVLEGSITLESDNEKLEIHTHDCFRFDGIENPVLVRSNTSVKMLYIATKPLYKDSGDFERELDALISQIDEKDSYTRRHSENVLRYSLAICRELKYADEILDRLAIAALFHDVGKCCMPDEILKGTQGLTAEQRKYVYKHPMESRKLLMPAFGREIANVAKSHHERLDGSGYPEGLEAEDIPLEAKIIAVADTFDAMTTQRSYNKKKSFLEAIEELRSLYRQYDQTIVEALAVLIEKGSLSQDDDGKVIQQE